MHVSEFISDLQKKCKGEDLDIVFKSYEWDDDLENIGYHEKDFHNMRKHNGSIVIRIGG